MLEVFQNFQSELSGQPLWVQIWVYYLTLINLASIFFVKRIEPRWVFVAFLFAATSMMVLFALQGFTRLLGLGHIIFWTPLILYLWGRRGDIYLTRPSGIYLHLVFLTIVISLVFDYVDLVRYFLGHSY